MRLYQHPISSNARRVLLTAAHIGAPLELVPVNLMSQEDRARLAELNPNNMIPVLEDGELLLWESHAIISYLCERQGGHAIYPAELKPRADIQRWLYWSAQHWSPAISVLTWEHHWKGVLGFGAADAQEVARGEGEFERFATVLDGHLNGRTWVVGDALTLADLALAAPLMYVRYAKLPLERYAHIAVWFARVQALACWKETEAEF